MAKIESWAKRSEGWSVVVHGGAGEVPSETAGRQAEGCREAAERAAVALRAGASVLEAACIAVQCLEDNPMYNAGTGAALNEAGELSFDASIMCGATLRAGAVGALPAFQNPIAVARAILEEDRWVLLCGEGAAKWAESRGFSRASAQAMITEASRARLSAVLRNGGHGGWAGGTVGCVVRDAQGHLAAATSTGGIVGKPIGRMGDSALIGAGTYADHSAGAVSNTGDGEAFMRTVAAKMAVENMRAGASKSEAIVMLLEEIDRRLGGLGGTISIDALGVLAWARSTRTMSWAAAAESWTETFVGY